ncbi:MAG TPA: hypothetical protein DC058_03135 [Planctomycetaceae bacterium]|nr:hypothetical protein [Planctomycetaceae bacterium]
MNNQACDLIPDAPPPRNALQSHHSKEENRPNPLPALPLPVSGQKSGTKETRNPRKSGGCQTISA